MTEYELNIAKGAFEHAIKTGAPGLSEAMREAVVRNAVLRIRHQLNLGRQPISDLGAQSFPVREG